MAKIFVEQFIKEQPELNIDLEEEYDVEVGAEKVTSIQSSSFFLFAFYMPVITSVFGTVIGVLKKGKKIS